jgi:serine/threonine protein kinase
MADGNWQRVRKIFDEALRQKPEERRNFVRRACDDDQPLLAEVESLLESLDDADSFLEKPAIARLAGEIVTEHHQIVRGQFLNHYQIIRNLGAGGMGEVYLAQDTKLNRKVALKILHGNLVSDKQARRRLLREAQAAALLDHPNICSIYEIAESEELSFIVMQYVEGRTIAELVPESRLTVEKSVDLAIQIADALAAAHKEGIIHRDIKPANIIVNDKGQAKVLDFGLAKFIEAGKDEHTSERLNSSGAVMGTVPFMSPEQLCGKPLDARTDIFSFGVLLYEMLTGRQPFTKENNAETISAILNDEPDWTSIPVQLQPILQKSLLKNKDLRYQSAQELIDDLQDLQKNGRIERPPTFLTSPNEQVETNEPLAAPKRLFYFWKSSDEKERYATTPVEIKDKPATKAKINWRNGFLWLTVFGSIAIFVLTGWFYRQFSAKDVSVNFNSLRTVRLFAWKSGASSNDTDYRVSPNGKMIAFSSTQNNGIEAIYVKQTTAEGEDVRVTKDKWRNVSPLWSPDDQRIAFVSVRENQPGIYVSPVFGGASTPLLITEKANISLRHWTKDGTAIFYEQGGNLYRLDLQTREIRQMTALADSPTGNDRYFSLSPDEKQIVFCDKREGQEDIVIMPLDGGEPLWLTNDKEDKLRPLWFPDGRQILYNVKINGDSQIKLAFTDARPPVQVTRGEGNYELVDISKDGAKIYYTNWEKKSDIGGVNVETGQEFEIVAGIETELWSDVSPDGKSVVYQTNTWPNLISNLNESRLVVKNLENQTQQVFGKGSNPRWLPDNRHLAFIRRDNEKQTNQLWLVNTITGQEKLLISHGVVSPSYGLMPVARSEIGEFDFSQDGKHFVYLQSGKARNIHLGTLNSSTTINLTNNENPNLRYFSPLFATDGKRIVWVSVEIPADKNQKAIWRVQVFEGEKVTEIYSTNESLRLVGWSASGREIILETTSGPMKAGPLDIKLIQASLTGSQRLIIDLKDIYANTMTLSADGQMAAFVARQNDKDDLWTVSLGTGETRKVTANSHTRLFYASPVWLPDGKAILFDKQDQDNTISMLENFR